MQGDLVEDRQVSDERAHRTGVERHGERRECESGKEELRPARPRGEHSRQRQQRGQRAHVERPLGEVRRLVRRQRGPIRAAPVLGKGQAEPHLGWQRRAGTRRDEGLAQRLHQRQDHDRADRRSKQRGGRGERADADGRAPIGTRGGQPVDDPGGRRKRHDHPALRLPAEVGHPEQAAQRGRVAHCPGAAETIRDQQQPRQQDIGIRVRVHQPHDQVGAEPERHRCKHGRRAPKSQRAGEQERSECGQGELDHRDPGQRLPVGEHDPDPGERKQRRALLGREQRPAGLQLGAPHREPAVAQGLAHRQPVRLEDIRGVELQRVLRPCSRRLWLEGRLEQRDVARREHLSAERGRGEEDDGKDEQQRCDRQPAKGARAPKVDPPAQSCSAILGASRLNVQTAKMQVAR